MRLDLPDRGYHREIQMKKKQLARKLIVYALYIVLFCSVQVSFSGFFSLGGQVADFMLVFVIITGYLYGAKDAAIVGIITGLLRDYFAGPSFEVSQDRHSALLGLGMLILFYAGVLSSVLFAKTFHRKIQLGFVQVMIITVAYKIFGHIATFVTQIFTGNGSQYLTVYEIILGSIIPQMLANLIAAVPVIILVRYFGPYKNGINLKLIAEADEAEGIWQIN